MAAFDDTPWIGPRQVRPTETQLTQIDNFDRGLGDVGRANLWRHTGYFTMVWTAPTQPNNNTVNGIQQTARLPFKVVAVECGAEAIGGTNVSADVEVDPAGGVAYATILETAPTALAAAAGTMAKGEVLDGSEDIDEGATWRVNHIATGAGAVTGHTVVMHCFRL